MRLPAVPEAAASIATRELVSSARLVINKACDSRSKRRFNSADGAEMNLAFGMALQTRLYFPRKVLLMIRKWINLPGNCDW